METQGKYVACTARKGLKFELTPGQFDTKPLGTQGDQGHVYPWI